MLPPELPPLPALTRAEGEYIDSYLQVLDLLGRIWHAPKPGSVVRMEKIWTRGVWYGRVR